MVTAKKSTVKVVAAAPKEKIAVKKPVAAKAAGSATAKRPAVNAEQRHHYIEVAAFYVAQRRGSAPGNPFDDWATAEVEVDQLILLGHFSK